ncbi:MAG TPA: VOC family protein [Armatimonadota bacterium]|jgi:predicted 3-demethylubiquinone-9 3-methyltransferase (glyoxalase superfamily)
MQKITPFLWFDKEAAEAAQLYTTVFAGAKITRTTQLHNTPSGTTEIISVALFGQEFTLMSAGPLFTFTPAVSLLVACRTMEEVEELWQGLSPGGTPLMELGAYPFSEKYGWLQDRYGLSWQIMFMGERPIAQRIIPTLMFVGAVYGKAEEAINFYTSVFRNAQVGEIVRYGKEQAPDREGTVTHASFTLEGQQFAAMDSAYPHAFAFNEAISFVVNCSTQAEIDYYWAQLSADPSAEQCGWLKDRYGLSWQVVPTVLADMLQDPDPEKVARVTEAFLQMKKFDLAALQRAYQGA